MKITPWRNVKHKASMEEMESLRHDAVTEAERLLNAQALQKDDAPSAADHSSKAA